MKLVLEMKNFLSLTFCQLGYRDTGPLRYNTADLVVCDLLMDHGQILVLHSCFRLFEFLYHFGQLTVLKLRRLVEIILALCDFNL